MWLTEGATKEGREQFDAQLNKPPAGVTAEAMKADPKWSPEAQGQDFMAQLAARGGAGRVAKDGVRKVEVGGEQ